MVQRLTDIVAKMRLLQQEFPVEASRLATHWARLAALHDERQALEQRVSADPRP